MSITPIRKIPVITMPSPDDWREPLGIVGVEVASDDFSSAVETLRTKLVLRAMELFPEVTMLCNFHWDMDQETVLVTRYRAVADAYGKVTAE